MDGVELSEHVSHCTTPSWVVSTYLTSVCPRIAATSNRLHGICRSSSTSSIFLHCKPSCCTLPENSYRSSSCRSSSTSRLIGGLIDGLIGRHSYLKRCGHPPRVQSVDDVRFDRQLEHAPMKHETQSKCVVHNRRVDTLFACGVYKVCMCPYPCFHCYHYMVDYGYEDPVKAAVAPARKRKR